MWAELMCELLCVSKAHVWAELMCVCVSKARACSDLMCECASAELGEHRAHVCAEFLCVRTELLHVHQARVCSSNPSTSPRHRSLEHTYAQPTAWRNHTEAITYSTLLNTTSP